MGEIARASKAVCEWGSLDCCSSVCVCVACACVCVIVWV